MWFHSGWSIGAGGGGTLAHALWHAALAEEGRLRAPHAQTSLTIHLDSFNAAITSDEYKVKTSRFA